jgi:molybdopterin-guanine dinucleotide biosynthesis protein A
MPIVRDQITGLVLAGGRGSRMGGIDKGLQGLRGEPLVAHALRRLAPQVGPRMISANRHLDAYAALGVTVWPDADPGFAGPLAGLRAGLDHAETPWLATVPCDSPGFPPDLVARLALAADVAGVRAAVAATRAHDGTLRREPVFCLLHASLRDDLAAFLHAGGRAVGAWLDRHAAVEVPFEDATAFANANTPDELHALQAAR